MLETKTDDTRLRQKAQKLYKKLRSKIEIPENIGRLIVMDVESGDYEIDDLGLEGSRRLQSRHPGAMLYALRIGYETVESFGGVLERNS